MVPSESNATGAANWRWAALFLGLLLNTGVLGLAFFLRSESQTGNRVPPPVAGTRAAAPTPAMALPQASELARILSGNEDAVLARLGAAEIPVAIRQAVAQFYAERRHQPALDRLASLPNEYWLSPLQQARSDRSRTIRELQEQINMDVRSMLGGTPYSSAGSEFAKKRFDYLPPATAVSVAQLLDDFNERISSESSLGGPVAGLRQALKGELQAILTPNEYEMYALRESPTAVRLRGELRSFAPSETEFVDIFRALLPVDEALAEEPEGMRPALALAVSGLAETLGIQRHQEYVTTTLPEYQALGQLAERIEVAPAVVPAILKVKRELTALGATAQVRDFSEAEEKLQLLLGKSGFTAYRQSFWGAWLRQKSSAALREALEQ